MMWIHYLQNNLQIPNFLALLFLLKELHIAGVALQDYTEFSAALISTLNSTYIGSDNLEQTGLDYFKKKLNQEIYDKPLYS